MNLNFKTEKNYNNDSVEARQFLSSREGITNKCHIIFSSLSSKTSLHTDDIFKECWQNPDCLAILLMCLHNLEHQVNSIVKESAEYKKIRDKSDKQLQDINYSVTLLSKKFGDYEKKGKKRSDYQKSAKQQDQYGKMNWRIRT